MLFIALLAPLVDTTSRQITLLLGTMMSHISLSFYGNERILPRTHTVLRTHTANTYFNANIYCAANTYYCTANTYCAANTYCTANTYCEHIHTTAVLRSTSSFVELHEVLQSTPPQYIIRGREDTYVVFWEKHKVLRPAPLPPKTGTLRLV